MASRSRRSHHKRKLSAYNKHVRDVLKAGGSMKSAAKSWHGGSHSHSHKKKRSRKSRSRRSRGHRSRRSRSPKRRSHKRRSHMFFF